MKSIAATVDLVVSWAESAVMIVAMATIVTLICVQVVLRYVFNESLIWVEELVRYLVVWMSLLGAGLGLKEKTHIAISILQKVLSPAQGRVVQALADVLILALGALLLVYGLRLALHTWSFGQLSSALRVPMGAVYLCLPLGGLLLIYRGGQSLLAGLTGSRTVKEDSTDIALSGGT